LDEQKQDVQAEQEPLKDLDVNQDDADQVTGGRRRATSDPEEGGE
jgi:hypothetical protein